MASLAATDSLNIIYYGEMELPAAEKKVRIVMAKQLQGTVSKYYDTVRAILADEKVSKRKRDILLAAAVMSLKNAYLSFFDKYYPVYINAVGAANGEPYYGVDAWRQKRALDFAIWITQTARNEPNLAFSQSHAATVTRTEVNSIGNLAALDAAYRQGKRFKTWKTFGDRQVRPTHQAANGTRIPIDEPFTVGDYKMMFPTDSSLGAGAEEIVNCRCVLEFDSGNGLTNRNERGIMRVRGGNVEQAKTRDKKIEITDIAISKANPPLIPDFSDEQNARFKELHQELLRLAKERNDSNEVAFLFDPKTMSYEKKFGRVSSVNIFENPLARDMDRKALAGELYLLHNHPSTKSFSYSDIGTFLACDSLGGMTVVTNAGVVYAICKTSRYDYTLALGVMKDIRSEYPGNVLNEIEDAEVVKRFLKVSRDCGIICL